MRTMPTRVDEELFETARTAGEVSSRSAAQQIGHWARIGRRLEAAPATTLRTVRDVLADRASYDDLLDTAQAVVRGAWDERIAARPPGSTSSASCVTPVSPGPRRTRQAA